jgi:hypothetical protein
MYPSQTILHLQLTEWKLTSAFIPTGKIKHNARDETMMTAQKNFWEK